MVMPYTRRVVVGKGGPDKYAVSFPQVLKSVLCPVDRCPGRANNIGRGEIAILQEVLMPLLWCNHCGMHKMVLWLCRHKRKCR